MGFSYHRNNLQKFGELGTLVGRDVRGTVLGMDDSAIAEMREVTGGLVTPRRVSGARSKLLESVNGSMKAKLLTTDYCPLRTFTRSH